MAKVKKLKCIDMGVSRNTTCTHIFNVESADMLADDMKRHYKREEPHFTDIKNHRGDMFVPAESEFDSKVTSFAKREFDRADWIY